MTDPDWRHLPPLSTLRAFEATARLEGYSAAARALNVTPAAIAQQVRKLEDEMGAALVRREGRGLVLTEAGRQLAAQHSHSFECWYAHVPGLKVLVPGTIEDARFMLGMALLDPDPVIIFEHVMLYNETGVLPNEAQPVPMEQAVVRRPGKDVSLITYGGSLGKVLSAASQLAGEGIEAEVLDLRCLRPLDTAAIVKTVARTHRAVVVDEGWRTGSLAGEISAIIMEQAFWELDAPVARVCSKEVPIPYPHHLEQAALPQIPQILAAVRQVLEHA